MRRRTILAALACTTLFAATSVPACAFDMPARKPGLWEMKISMEGRNLPVPAAQHCIDAATDKQMQQMGEGMSKCSKQEVTNVGGKMVFDSVCQVGTMTSTSHGEITGSFDSAYTVKMTSKRDGAPIPGMPPTTNMTIEAKWLGPCKPDQKPGDMIMGNGMKMNINDLQKMQGMVRPGMAPQPAR
jgi:hypothetical protein